MSVTSNILNIMLCTFGYYYPKCNRCYNVPMVLFSSVLSMNLGYILYRIIGKVKEFIMMF